MEEMDKFKLVGYILGGVIIGAVLFLIIYFIFNISSTLICEKECDKLNALDFQIIPSGHLKVDDLCVCYFKNGTKSFRMGE